MKRFAQLVPMLIVFGLIIALIAGAVAVVNELMSQIDRW